MGWENWEDGTSWGHLSWSSAKTQRYPEKQQWPPSRQRPQCDDELRHLKRKNPRHPFVGEPVAKPGKLWRHQAHKKFLFQWFWIKTKHMLILLPGMGDQDRTGVHTYYFLNTLKHGEIFKSDNTQSYESSVLGEKGENKVQIQRFIRVCVKSLQLCLTLCDSMDRTPPGSSVLGILQARILGWVATPSSRGSSQPRDRARVSGIGRWVLYHQHHLGSPYTHEALRKVSWVRGSHGGDEACPEGVCKPWGDVEEGLVPFHT